MFYLDDEEKEEEVTNTEATVEETTTVEEPVAEEPKTETVEVEATRVESTETDKSTEGKSKMAAGILAILLGYLGVHNFYLGNTGKAVAQLLLSLLGGWICGLGILAAAIWGITEGVMIFTGKIDTDANGNPLVD